MRFATVCHHVAFAASILVLLAGCRNNGTPNDPFARRIIPPQPTGGVGAPPMISPGYAQPPLVVPGQPGANGLQPVPGVQPGPAQWTPQPGVGVRPASTSGVSAEGWTPVDENRRAESAAPRANATAANANGASSSGASATAAKNDGEPRTFALPENATVRQLSENGTAAAASSAQTVQPADATGEGDATTVTPVAGSATADLRWSAPSQR